ncbi:MAG: Mrp/NBP35 family ATP-binding protein [Ferrimicrobium sp.]
MSDDRRNSVPKDLESEIYSALGAVRDEELGGDVVSLGLVASIDRGFRRNRVTLYYVGGATQVVDDLRSSASAALAQVGSIDLELVALEPEGQRALKERLVDEETARARESRIPRFSSPGSTTRVLGISSGKGGVGKSTVSANVAVELARRGARVAILDADVYGFSIPSILGVTHVPRVVDDLIIPPRVAGVSVMSLGFFVEDDTPVIWRGPMLHKTIEQFLIDVHWGTLDYLVVDMPPGTGDVTLSLQEYLPRSEVFVVTTPQSAARRVAQRSALAARKLRLPVRGVIENMAGFVADDGRSYPIFGSGGGDALAAQLDVPVVGRIPLTMALREGGDQGVPVVTEHPDDPASVAFRATVDSIVALGPTRRYRADLKVQGR